MTPMIQLPKLNMGLPNTCEWVHMSLSLLLGLVIHVGLVTWLWASQSKHRLWIVCLWCKCQCLVRFLITRTRALDSLTSSCHSDPLFELETFCILCTIFILLNIPNDNCEFVAHTFTHCNVLELVLFIYFIYLYMLRSWPWFTFDPTTSNSCPHCQVLDQL